MGAVGAGADEARILSEELAQGLDIACDDGLGSGFEAGVGGIAALEGSNLPGELRPAFKSVGAGEDKLGLGQREFAGRALRVNELLELRDPLLAVRGPRASDVG